MKIQYVFTVWRNRQHVFDIAAETVLKIGSNSFQHGLLDVDQFQIARLVSDSSEPTSGHLCLAAPTFF